MLLDINFEAFMKSLLSLKAMPPPFRLIIFPLPKLNMDISPLVPITVSASLPPIDKQQSSINRISFLSQRLLIFFVSKAIP